MRTRLEEYEICIERGHKADPRSGATMDTGYNAVPHYICQYCGTTFWATTTTVEHEQGEPTTQSDREKQ